MLATLAFEFVPGFNSIFSEEFFTHKTQLSFLYLPLIQLIAFIIDPEIEGVRMAERLNFFMGVNQSSGELRRSRSRGTSLSERHLLIEL